MPLRAVLSGEDIEAFRLTPEEWRSLKASYRDKAMTMYCCDRGAVPKTSKLGTQYFAHARRGDCATAPESAHHIALKTTFAKAALAAGWRVTTERRGETPSGEEWVADVFCEKAGKRVAIEIQWTHQSLERYAERTRRYLSSGVFCLWISKLRANKKYWLNELQEYSHMPVFGVSRVEETYRVPRYDLELADFASGVFTGRLHWFPKKGQSVMVRTHYAEDRCVHCKATTNVVTRLAVSTEAGQGLKVFPFVKREGGAWACDNLEEAELQAAGVGPLERRYRRSVDDPYVTNRCRSCDALISDYFIARDLVGDDSRHITKRWRYDPAALPIPPGWYFDTSRGMKEFIG